MKKLLLTFAVMLFALNAIWAQRTISGTVLDAEGNPLSGVAVLIKGTTIGAYTDSEGKYTLDVPSDASTLVYTYLGMQTLEEVIGERNSIDLALSPDDLSLDEVVVTALGIKREERSLGYSVQEVSGDAVTQVKDQNIVSALAGKVAGVQVVSSGGAALGGSAKIRIRGSNSLSGGSPLFVVDGTPISNYNPSGQDNGQDFGNFAQDINPDDIESISVLKGPAGAALYGNRGADGVILITTKKGSARQGIGVTINSAVTFEKVYILPDYQNEYGGGYTQDFLRYTDPVDGQTYNGLNYSADESWGPRMDGTLYRPWWSWYPGTPEYGTQIPMESNPDNVRNFFETGVTLNNNVAVTGGNERSTFRLSYTNIYQTGVLPNSRLRRNNLSLNGEIKATDKLTFNASLNIAIRDAEGLGTFGYVGDYNPVMSFNQWFQRQLDMDRLADYKNPDGTFRSWNIRSPDNLRPLYWDSPYATMYENVITDGRDRYFGNVGLSYEILDNLTVDAAFRRDSYDFRNDRINASGLLSQDRYSESITTATEDNYELILRFDDDYGPFSVDVTAGGNIRSNIFRQNSAATAGGLSSPGWYNVEASIDRPSVNDYLEEKVIRSVFGSASIGFKDVLYLDASLRNDWSSALPEGDNAYLYPSISTSFIFSELIPTEFLSFGKLRATYAQSGSDLGPYQTRFVYGGGTPYGSLPTFGLPNTLINQNITAALSTAYEVGLDMRFFNNRLGFDFTYYLQQREDEILTLTVPGSSGFSAAIINAGLLESEGFELALYGTPVSTSKIKWDLQFNIATNESRVEELADGLDNRQLDSWGWGGLSVNAPVGQEWGTFRGRGFTYIDGQKVINEDGSFVREDNKDLGGLLPDFTGGLRSILNVYGFELMAFVDYQIGGQFHSVTKMFTAYSGLSAETVGNNDKGNPIRNPVEEGGGIKVEGVLADGTPHSVYVDPQTHYSSNLFAMNENWMYDATYFKLRELRVGYNLPNAILAKTPIQNANISLIARNLWLIHAEVDGLDPSEINPGSSNYVFQENGQLPGVRSFGLNVRLGF